LWEQQLEIGETDELYAMFLAYSTQPPGSRSILDAYRIYSNDSSKRNSSDAFTNVSVAFHWEERAARKDVEQLRTRYQLWTARDWEWREDDYNLGKRLREEAEAALDALSADDKKMSVPVIADVATMASNLQRNAIPTAGALSQGQLKELMQALPHDKRQAVLKAVMIQIETSDSNSNSNSNNGNPGVTVREVDDDDIVEGEVVEVESKSLPAPARPRGRPRRSSAQLEEMAHAT